MLIAGHPVVAMALIALYPAIASALLDLRHPAIESAMVALLNSTASAFGQKRVGPFSAPVAKRYRYRADDRRANAEEY